MLNKTDAASGAGTAYTSGHRSSPPVFNGISVAKFLVFYVHVVFY